MQTDPKEHIHNCAQMSKKSLKKYQPDTSFSSLIFCDFCTFKGFGHFVLVSWIKTSLNGLSVS